MARQNVSSRNANVSFQVANQRLGRTSVDAVSAAHVQAVGFDVAVLSRSRIGLAVFDLQRPAFRASLGHYEAPQTRAAPCKHQPRR